MSDFKQRAKDVLHYVPFLLALISVLGFLLNDSSTPAKEERMQAIMQQSDTAIGKRFIEFMNARKFIQPHVWTLLERPTKEHLRGLCAVSDSVVWASGTGGTVLRSTDGGRQWDVIQISGAAELDFRDIHAFNDQQAVVMSSGEGVAFYRTDDGGQQWKLVYQDSRTEVFFDGMDFVDPAQGWAYGDPVDGRFQVLETDDGGQHWKALAKADCPEAMEDEAGFAASGTGIIIDHRGEPWIATGNGEHPRILNLGEPKLIEPGNLPLQKGAGCGIYGMAYHPPAEGDEHEGVLLAVGGNYLDSANSTGVCARSTDLGKHWMQPYTGMKPRGYRSGVAISPDGKLAICVGRTGSDASIDLGKNWKPMGDDGFYAVAIQSHTAWAVGRNGKMARMEY